MFIGKDILEDADFSSGADVEEQEKENYIPKPPSVPQVLKDIQKLQTYFYLENKFLYELGNTELHVISCRLNNKQKKIYRLPKLTS